MTHELERMIYLQMRYEFDTLDVNDEQVTIQIENPKQKCPECGSLKIKDGITCIDCGYEYFVWDVA